MPLVDIYFWIPACLSMICAMTMLTSFVFVREQTACDYGGDGFGKGEWPRKRFIRRTRINVLGMTAFLVYLAALGFYIFVSLCTWHPQHVVP